MPTVQGSFGEILLFDHFMGPEMPVATASAYGAQYSAIGPFRVVGDLVETDTGVVGLEKAGGWIRISGNNEDSKGVALVTSVSLSPTLNGPILVEARIEMQALTTRVVFVGICGTLADDVAEPVTATGTTLTLVASHLCGFLYDSQLTDGDWHMVYNGGTATGPTDSTTVDANEAPVAADAQILRLEVDRDGTARWYIDGKLKQTVANAVSATTLQGGVLGCWGTTTTAADVDADYFGVRANTDWTV